MKKLRLLLFVSFLGINAASPVSAMLEPEDKFTFLREKYPALAEKSFTHCEEERGHYHYLASLTQKSKKTPAFLLEEAAKRELGIKTLHCFGEKHEKFVRNQIQPMIDTLKQGHPTHGYFHTFFARALENHTFLEDILLSAEYIFQTVKDAGGGTVLFLGRTPCLVQVAYEELLKVEKDETQSPLHLNFSGHPDALTKRVSPFFQSPTNMMRDIVTPQRLEHYFSYLDTKNILSAKKLFIVDILGSGSGLNSFLRLLDAYAQKRGLSLPAHSFLNLTQDMNWSVERPFYTFEQTGSAHNRGTLTLPEDKTKNMKRFQLAAQSVPIFDKVLTKILDLDMFQEFLVHGIQYPAQKWTPEFDAQRDKGGDYHAPFYSYLRPIFSNLIPYHQKTKGPL